MGKTINGRLDDLEAAVRPGGPRLIWDVDVPKAMDGGCKVIRFVAGVYSDNAGKVYTPAEVAALRAEWGDHLKTLDYPLDPGGLERWQEHLDRRLSDLEAIAKPKGEPRCFVFWQSLDDDNLYRGTWDGESKTFTREELDRLESDNPDDIAIVVRYVKDWRGYPNG